MESGLFECFNTTNQTSPRFARHVNFARPLVPQDCKKVTLLQSNERCEFVTNSEHCKQIMFTLQYLSFFYCSCDDTYLNQSLCMGLMIVFLSFLFWMVYVITYYFFLSALTEILKALNLTEYLAGITVMALGNRAPDLLMISMGSTSVFYHLYSDSVATCIFACVFSSSIITWVQPFAMEGTIFIRDIGFLLCFICYVDFSIKYNNGLLRMNTVLSITSIFIIYILVVIIDEYLQFRKKKKLKEVRINSYFELNSRGLLAPFSVKAPLWETESGTLNPPNMNLFKQFVKAFDVLDRKMFSSKWTFCKLWALIKMPPMVIWTLLIPQMDLIQFPDSWSKLLCCTQIPLVPTFILLAFVFRYSELTQMLNWILPLLFFVPSICMPLSFWAFHTSRTDRVPPWYKYINILSITSSIMMLSIVSTELIALLKTLGVIFNLSDTFISCTLFTWGAGAADIIANVTMARKGFPRMAYSACFGVTIFTMFCLLCIPLIINTHYSETGYIEFSEGTIGKTLSTILTISLITQLIYGSITNFMLRRSGALIGITLYFYSLILITSSEFEFNHAFGADHQLDRSHFMNYEP